MISPKDVSKHPGTHETNRRHQPPKWTKQNNPWGLSLVTRVAKVHYSNITFVFFRRVWLGSVLLECEWPVLEMSLGLLKCKGQNELKVRICVDFSSLRDENVRRLPCLWYGGPNLDGRGLLTFKNPSHGIRNVPWWCCKITIISSVTNHLTCEQFLVRKNHW